MFSRLKQFLFRKKTSVDEGAYWEKKAARHLRKKGYRLVTRNWKGRRGEIDLVMWQGQTLVFIEVRARANSALVSGYHSINAHKKRLLRETCMQYLGSLKVRPQQTRLDVVEVAHSGHRDYEIRVFEGVSLS